MRSPSIWFRTPKPVRIRQSGRTRIGGVTDPPSLSPNLYRYSPTSFSLLFSSSFYFYFFEFRLEKNLFGSFVLMDLLLFFFFLVSGF